MASFLSAVLLFSACTRSEPDATTDHTATVIVFAASSLTDAFGDIGERFEEVNPGLHVSFSFGPSDGLAQQVGEGAPADVFASASPKWMDVVEEGTGVVDRADFARNRLVIVTPADNPAKIHDVADLANPGVQLVLAAEGVPVGDYAREMLTNAHVEEGALANVVSNEVDARSMLAKVAAGEADAGVVYVTDVTDETRSDVHEVDIPDDVNVIATYPIGVVNGSGNIDEAKAFVAFVVGDEGQQVLRRYGFLPPK